MRVMVIVKATKESEKGLNPGDEKMLKEMGAFPELTHSKTVGTLPWQHIAIFKKK